MILVFSLHLPSCWNGTLKTFCCLCSVATLWNTVVSQQGSRRLGAPHSIPIGFYRGQVANQIKSVSHMQRFLQPSKCRDLHRTIRESTPGFLPLQGEAEISRVQLRLSAHLTDSRSCGELEQSWYSKAKSANFKWRVADWNLWLCYLDPMPTILNWLVKGVMGYDNDLVIVHTNWYWIMMMMMMSFRNWI